MSTKSVFKMGFLSMVAATGLFGASNGFAADAHTTSNFEGVKANTVVAAQAREATGDTRAVSDDVKMPATQRQVVDSNGNVYLLTPLQTKDGKASVEYVVPYTMPTSH
jgi:hypothetical protein